MKQPEFSFNRRNIRRYTEQQLLDAMLSEHISNDFFNILASEYNKRPPTLEDHSRPDETVVESLNFSVTF